MTKLQINHSRHEYVTREPDPEDGWDHGNTAATIQVYGASLAGRWYDIESDFDVKVGDTLYLVWVDYDTGSTFGRACNQVEFVDVFRSEKEASALRDSILKGDIKDYSVKYINDGKEKSHDVEWVGYFEGLNNAHVDEFVVKPTPNEG